MGLKVEINSITGQTPYYVFVCQSTGVGCVYVDKFDTTPYEFEIPKPYDTYGEYKLKIYDGNSAIITGNAIVS